VRGRCRWARSTTLPHRIPSENEAREAALLYFAYTARIEPERMSEVAPGAEFRFIAHLPQWGLDWPIVDQEWQGGLPTIVEDAGSTVWGAVFEVPEDEFDQLDKAESKEGRKATTLEAMDRTGRRHSVTVHRAEANGSVATPSTEYVSIMLRGSKHWSLPFGWIAGLEEHLGETT
jgi:gamma-glutamylcyclotransferase (GGCT)/AIG2-like uncharacterized protein YtfP